MRRDRDHARGSSHVVGNPDGRGWSALVEAVRHPFWLGGVLTLGGLTH